jgi:RNA polymerase sigma-70 factor (ECF subfamily)
MFEAERPRLLGIATRVLADHAEAEDVVQRAWLRFDQGATDIESVPAWLTTVTTRLCLDQLRSRTPVPTVDLEVPDVAPDVADDVSLSETVGLALQLVLDRLSPQERVAFVLHDSFGFEFPTIATILGTTPVAARKLASRARAKVRQPAPEDELADWAVVDAFMAAARNGDFDRLMQLLAPDVVVTADDAAILAGTPERIEGRREVGTFFNGSAQAALAVYVDDRPGAAWFHRGQAKVLFDFTIVDGCRDDRQSHDSQQRTKEGTSSHEDNDLPPARGTVRSRAPREYRRRGHQGPGPPPQGGGTDRGRHPPAGAGRDEGSLAAPQEVDGLVRRDEAGLRRPPRGLSPARCGQRGGGVCVRRHPVQISVRNDPENAGIGDVGRDLSTQLR